jgi:hypothetical protein
LFCSGDASEPEATVRRRGEANEWSAAVAGVLLLVLTLAGAVWGVRAAIAQALYYHGRHGAAATRDGDRAGRLLALCAQGQRLYPFNYLLCAHAAEQAYWSARERGDAPDSERQRLARLWCERGLSLNPHSAPLRRLMARFLWEDDPDEALEYWRAYVNWDFWQPGHHGVLARLYADVGDFEQAEAELRWAEPGPAYADDKAHVERARKAFLEGDWE